MKTLIAASAVLLLIVAAATGCGGKDRKQQAEWRFTEQKHADVNGISLDIITVRTPRQGMDVPGLAVNYLLQGPSALGEVYPEEAFLIDDLGNVISHVVISPLGPAGDAYFGYIQFSAIPHHTANTLQLSVTRLTREDPSQPPIEGPWVIEGILTKIVHRPPDEVDPVLRIVDRGPRLPRDVGGILIIDQTRDSLVDPPSISGERPFDKNRLVYRLEGESTELDLLYVRLPSGAAVPVTPDLYQSLQPKHTRNLRRMSSHQRLALIMRTSVAMLERTAPFAGHRRF